MAGHGPTSRRSGQALIESCLVVAIVCLAFFGAFQVSQLFAAQEVLHYAAGRGARAKVVGFNRFMVDKTIRVGAIPNAGLMITPGKTGGPASQYLVEKTRIPLYLGAETYGELDPILNYDDWNSVQADPAIDMGDGTLHLEVHQAYPLNIAMAKTFYAAPVVFMTGHADLEEHSSLYLNNEDW